VGQTPSFAISHLSCFSAQNLDSACGAAGIAAAAMQNIDPGILKRKHQPGTRFRVECLDSFCLNTCHCSLSVRTGSLVLVLFPVIGLESTSPTPPKTTKPGPVKPLQIFEFHLGKRHQATNVDETEFKRFRTNRFFR
jgi:hypothetical protein